MKIIFLTITLDGFPFITRHLQEFEKLDLDWEWRIAEGVAGSANCTKWCKPLAPRLSNDGTTGYLESIAAWDHRVKLWQKELWHGKVSMLNAMCQSIREPCLIWEIDSDECWRTDQIRRMSEMFKRSPKKNSARFWCRYFIGRNIVITSRGGYGNNDAFEWKRVWRWEPGMKWKSHEPPVISGFEERAFTHAETEKNGLVFDHYAYATEAQVRFKSLYYGSENNEGGKLYKSAVDGWRKIQMNREWPVKELKEFLPWVGDGVKADRL